MDKRMRAALGIILSLTFMSCAATKPMPPKAPDVEEVQVYTGLAITVAILNFENNSITDVDKVEPLTKGLATMFATDLAKFKSVQIVEREKILAIIEEMKLSQSGMLSNNTAVQVGKMVGAKNIILGSFVVLGGTIRIDVRMIEVETSLLVLAEQVVGVPESLFEMEKLLIRRIIAGLNVELSKREEAKFTEKPKGSFQAAIYYSRGVEYMDAKNYDVARQMFSKALKLDPNFEAAKEKLNRLP